MSRIIDQMMKYGRFARGLKAYLDRPIPASECDRLIAERLKQRPANLLSTVRRAIYGHEGSPYRRLLRNAGCEYGDFERLVAEEGVEGTLSRLAGQGVFFTIDEFKGRKEVVRGSLTFACTAADFDSPLGAGHLEARTGASRGAGARTVYDLDHLAQKWAVQQRLRIAACDAVGIPVGMWLPIMPGAGTVALLAYAKIGVIPERWFSPVERRGFKPSLQCRLGTSFVVHAGRLWGARFPRPEYVAFDDAERIARWMSTTIRSRGRCYMATYVSAAVRISQAAQAAGLDLTGSVFSVSSEPFTRAKKREIEASGAEVHPMYAFMEAGIVAMGCRCPTTADDYHLLDDCVALVQHRTEVPHAEVAVDAFLFTTLLASAPKVMLNVETGDYGRVEQRRCGCMLERRGFSTHVHHVRSFEKLTGEGMGFFGTDLIRLIEQVLPSRFGGSSTSYQIVEEEDTDGQTRVSIIVAPELGEIDEEALRTTVLTELSREDEANRLMAAIWSDAGILRILRERPTPTERGKLLPLHIR